MRIKYLPRIADGKVGDCTTCPYWVGFNNRRPGIRIPHPAPPPKFGFGKCTRKEGHCSPHKVRW